MNRWLAHGVFALVSIAVVGLTAFVLSLLSEPPAPLEQKVELADRVLYYRLLDDADVVFQLNGGERVVKLVTHAIVDGNSGYNPHDRVPYGVRCELSDQGGEPLWSAEVWTQSRQSKAQLVDGVWMKENAFSLERGSEIADDRNLLVALPDRVPVGARLRLSKLGGVREVVVRGYRRDIRTGLERQSALRSLAPGERDELIARTTYSPWDLVPVWERLSRLRFRFQRLAAIGDSGTDFLTRPVWFTGFRTPIRDALAGADDSAPIAADDEAEIERRRAYVVGSWSAAAGAEPASFAVQAGAIASSRAFRFIAHSIHPVGGGDGPVGEATAVVRFRDARGDVVAEDRFAVPAPQSTGVGRAPGSRGVLADGRWWPVGPEADVRIVAPVGATRAELSSRGPAIAVRAFVYLPPPHDDEASAAADDGAGDRFWFGLLPDEASQLAGAGREVRLLYRPSETAPVASAASRRVYRALAPWPTLGERLVFEPVEGDARKAAAARWSSGSWTEVRTTAVRFAEANRGVPELRYSVAPTDADADIVVRIDGIEVARARSRAPSGRIRLPPVADGVRTVAVETAAKSLRAFIDRPPVGPGARVWRARTVYPLADTPKRVQFFGSVTERVSVHVYAPADLTAAPRLRFTLDRGDPARVEGRVLARYTVADRVVSVPPSERPEAQFFPDGGSAGRGSVASIPIGDDLVPGPHVLELRNLSGQRLWVSFFATDYVGKR